VIPAAGLGTRLLPVTRAVPKEMLPILDRPIVQYIVDELADAGMRRVLLVTARGKEAIEEHFRGDPRIRFARQPEPRGLGDAVAHAEAFADRRPVVLALGDAVMTAPADPATPRLVTRLIAAHLESGACATLAVVEVPREHVRHYGIVVPVQPGQRMDVDDLIEKPAPGTVSSRYAIAARYVLGPEVFAALRDTPPDSTGEVQLTDALRRLIRGGGRVIAVPLAPGERRHDTGTLEGYAATWLEFALRHPQLGPELRARAAELLHDEQS
jgi:UTP--glucose-1-phosphate uridylyltransferase